MKDKIIELLNNSENGLSLKEIYNGFPEAKKESIRGTLNVMAKTGLIVRAGRGLYKKA